jgi:hypothetical protein
MRSIVSGRSALQIYDENPQNVTFSSQNPRILTSKKKAVLKTGIVRVMERLEKLPETTTHFLKRTSR